MGLEFGSLADKSAMEMNAATYNKQPFLTLFRLLFLLADFCRKADTSLILYFILFGSVSSSNSGSLFADKKIAKKVLNCSYINLSYALQTC